MMTFDAVCFGQTGNEIVYTDSCGPSALYFYLFKFTVRHGFKHFPRDTMAREVSCVVLRFCFGKYVVNITVTLL